MQTPDAVRQAEEMLAAALESETQALAVLRGRSKSTSGLEEALAAPSQRLTDLQYREVKAFLAVLPDVFGEEASLALTVGGRNYLWTPTSGLSIDRHSLRLDREYIESQLVEVLHHGQDFVLAALEAYQRSIAPMTVHHARSILAKSGIESPSVAQGYVSSTEKVTLNGVPVHGLEVLHNTRLLSEHGKALVAKAEKAMSEAFRIVLGDRDAVAVGPPHLKATFCRVSDSSLGGGGTVLLVDKVAHLSWKPDYSARVTLVQPASQLLIGDRDVRVRMPTAAETGRTFEALDAMWSDVIRSADIHKAALDEVTGHRMGLAELAGDQQRRALQDHRDSLS